MPFLLEYGGLCHGLKNVYAKVKPKVVNAFARKMIYIAKKFG